MGEVKLYPNPSTGSLTVALEKPHYGELRLIDGTGKLIKVIEMSGNTEKIDDSESDVYWTSRPRESRIGAWASQQSELLTNRGELEARIKEYEEKFANQDVPRPPHWYGYRLVPRRIEFWKEGAYRLHQRTIYERGEADWNRFELYP